MIESRRRRRAVAGVGVVALAAALIASLLVTAPRSAAATTTLTSSGDSYINSGSSSKNFGTANPEYASASVYRTLLKFDTTSIPSGAALSSVDLFVYSTKGWGSGGFQVHPESTIWTEGGVTWSNQPNWNNTVIATSPAASSAKTLDIPLPLSSVSLGSETDFGLTFSTSGVAATLASREDASHPPQLSIVYNAVTPSASPSATPSDTATPSPTASVTPSDTGTPSPSTSPTPTGNPYCGTASGTPVTSKLMVIFEENKSYTSIMSDPDADNSRTFANSCGLATNYFALTHMSLSNYLAATSGLSYNFSPFNINCQPSTSCQTGNDNIFHQVGPSGWKSYQESMPGNCSSSSSSPYAARHNPALYYTNIAAACATNDVPLGSASSGILVSDVNAGTLPTYSVVTPNLSNDMHDGSVLQGDSWLGTWIPLITSGSDYQSGRLAIAITWDEGSGAGDTPSQVATIFMSRYLTPGTRSSTYFNHNSLYQLALDIAGLGARRAFGF